MSEIAEGEIRARARADAMKFRLMLDEMSVMDGWWAEFPCPYDDGEQAKIWKEAFTFYCENGEG